MPILDQAISAEGSQADTYRAGSAEHSGPPLVSIVTPSFNQGRFIRETIVSVLSQDYPRVEYWVIDGGSTDETLGIVREYESDPRFNWISEPDKGQSDAINRGLARCSGELFMWLNTDDLLLPGALRHIADTWMAGEGAAIIYGRGRLIDEHGQDLGYCPAQSSQMTLEQILRMRFSFVQPATCVPTAAVRAVGGVDLGLHYAMDFDLWIKLAMRLPIRYAPFDLASFRLHPTSKTVSLAQRFIEDVTVVFDRAAQARLLAPQQARARAYMFAAGTYLTPEAFDLRAALASVAAACRSDIRIIPKAAFVVTKGFARMALGDRIWSWVRYMQVKLR